MEIIWKGSPNWDSNRNTIDRVVIHWFGKGTLSSANSRFQTAGNSSAHYGISNSLVWQWVKEEKVAYHASNYVMNQRSIGIEHDAGIDPLHDPSEQSYQTSGELVRIICKKYNIPLNRTHIIGHNEVKATQCPGTVSIDKIISIAKGVISVPITDQTKILLGDNPDGQPWGDNGQMEVQAVRSTLNDQYRTIISQAERIKVLEDQLSQPQPSPVPVFTKPVAILHFELAKEFEK